MSIEMKEEAGGSSSNESAIHAWVDGHRIAFAVMTPKELERITFISTHSVADPDSPAPKNHGYQRDPMEDRFPSIGKYYLENPHLITPLIISVRLSDPEEINEFEELLNQGRSARIHERWGSTVVSVVDGQHRRGGLIWAAENSEGSGNPFSPSVPVMLYFGLTYEDEARLFDTINATQRKLPKALIEWTAGDITERGTNTHRQRIREIAFGLARDEDSVWCGDINMSGARDPDRKITYEGLRRSTGNMFPVELLERIDARGGDNHEPLGYAKRYWELVAKTCKVPWTGHVREEIDPDTNEPNEVNIPYRIKELVGVASLARLGKEILTSSLEHDEPDEKMVELVSKLSEVDWEKVDTNVWMKSQAGFAGQKDLFTTLHRLVYLDIRPGTGE